MPTGYTLGDDAEFTSDVDRPGVGARFTLSDDTGVMPDGNGLDTGVKFTLSDDTRLFLMEVDWV